MENIFENAYFGKPYKTRDGKKAIYNKKRILAEGWHFVLEESGMMIINDKGLLFENNEHPYDIVSEWKEEIDEDKLDEIAYLEFYKDQEACYYENELDIYKSAFKAGYRKAKEEDV